MALRYGLNNPPDLLAKLHRDHERIKEKVTPDSLFNFVVTAYHITDWVQNDPEVPNNVKNELQTIRANVWLRTCRDLANASKHFTLDKNYKNQVAAKTSVIAAHVGEAASVSADSSIVIVLNDGQRFDPLALAQGVMAVWDTFFQKYRL